MSLLACSAASAGRKWLICKRMRGGEQRGTAPCGAASAHLRGSGRLTVGHHADAVHKAAQRPQRRHQHENAQRGDRPGARRFSAVDWRHTNVTRRKSARARALTHERAPVRREWPSRCRAAAVGGRVSERRDGRSFCRGKNVDLPNTRTPRYKTGFFSAWGATGAHVASRSSKGHLQAGRLLPRLQRRLPPSWRISTGFV